MKKILFALLASLVIFQGASMGADTTTGGIFSTLKNAIIKDVTDTVTSTFTSTATSALNKVKLIQYKNELAQKKQELAELEASNKNFIVKFFKRRSLNNQIANLEEKIAELEK